MSGEYDPKDDKPIVDPRGNVHTQNETKFKYWAMEQYGMTAEEYRGYTFKGTGKTILETAGAYFKVTAPIDAKNGITCLAKKGVTPKNVLKAAFGMTDSMKERTTTRILSNNIINTSKSEINLIQKGSISSLNKRQRELLELLNNPGDTIIIRKKSVSMNDLRQLTKATGDEFNMFTNGGRRLIIKGKGNQIKVSREMYDDIISGIYGKFSGHTHPGRSLDPGPADEPFLKKLGQTRSSIWGNADEGWRIFGQEPWLTKEIRGELNRQLWAKIYGVQK